MRSSALAAAAAAALAAAGPASASPSAEEAKWEKKEFECKRPEKGCHIPTCCQYGFAVYTREKAGSAIREVKAVGEVDAPPQAVFDVVTAYEIQKGNMPYVEDAKVYKRTEDEVIFWTVANFPLVSRRDWVLKSKLIRNLPGGAMQATWEVTDEPQAPQPADGVVRLRINTGSWTLEPLDGGKRTRAVYYLYTDPGGSIPSFIANKANTVALPDLFAAVRKRSEKLGK